MNFFIMELLNRFSETGERISEKDWSSIPESDKYELYVILSEEEYFRIIPQNHQEE